ncbi:MAG: 6,7-dimethyl-8-ribityllumazine synthase [Candidatus Marinimicrobia bacterium]|nr:6,7-dimethyl-8-ribityllumazine synthase [Candidatus Neomarinimicrobiota bacterium]
MVKNIEGRYFGEKLKIALIASRFNETITKKLIEGAVDCLTRHGTDNKDIHIVWVPGAFEIPKTAKEVAESGLYDGVICLGAVIRGATPHFDYIAAETAKGIAKVGIEADVPIIFGVLTTDTIEQALERAGTKAGNKGWDAALNLLEMVDLFKQLRELKHK